MEDRISEYWFNGDGLDSRLPMEPANDVGTINVSRILRAVLDAGPIARAEIADQVGLTRGTVTRIAAKLLDVGLLLEGEPVPSPFGRPMVPLSVSSDTRKVATAHFGANEIRLGLVSIDGVVLIESRIPYPTNEPASLVKTLAIELRDLVSVHTNPSHVLGLGVSIGGWVDAREGLIRKFDPQEWSDVPLARLLREELEMSVFFDQMVRGMALAEMMFGVAKGTSDFFEIYVGDVLGAAQVQGGAVHRGLHGAAGMVSHLPVRGQNVECPCGRKGCLQALAANPAIIRRAREKGVLASGEGLAHLVIAAEHNTVARELILQGARHLATAMATVIDILGPSSMVLVGVLPMTPGFLETFKATLAAATEHGATANVVLSKLGHLAPTVASAAVLLEAYYRDPLGFEQAISKA